MAEVAAAMAIASTVIGTVGAIKDGQNKNAQAKDQAEQYRRKALAEKAAAQHRAEQRNKDGERLASDQKAAMGASGGGFDTQMLGDTISLGDLNARMELARGNDAANSLKYSAELTEAGGKSSAANSYFKAGSSFLSGASSIYANGKFGSSGNTLAKAG